MTEKEDRARAEWELVNSMPKLPKKKIKNLKKEVAILWRLFTYRIYN